MGAGCHVPRGPFLWLFGGLVSPPCSLGGCFGLLTGVFWGGLRHVWAVSEGVWVICCCGWQQRGWRCSNLCPVPILGLIPVPPGVKVRDLGMVYLLAAVPSSFPESPAPLSTRAGGSFSSPCRCGMVGPHGDVEFLLGSSSLTVLLVSHWHGAGPLGPPLSPVTRLRVPPWRFRWR